jgi:hypothetical protein
MLPENPGRPSADAQYVLTDGVTESDGEIVVTFASDPFGSRRKPENLDEFAHKWPSNTDDSDALGRSGLFPRTDEVNFIFSAKGLCKTPGKSLNAAIMAELGEHDGNFWALCGHFVLGGKVGK